MEITSKWISSLHNGLKQASIDDVHELMPEILPILETVPDWINLKNFLIDVKVHMLKPNMFPCIPNWHLDNIPRDHNGQELMALRDRRYKMYLWISNPPLTEFEDGREIRPQEWFEFTQFDKHRGTPSQDATWRLFIRLIPRALINRTNEVLRRHSQVYLDSKEFSW